MCHQLTLDCCRCITDTGLLKEISLAGIGLLQMCHQLRPDYYRPCVINQLILDCNRCTTDTGLLHAYQRHQIATGVPLTLDCYRCTTNHQLTLDCCRCTTDTGLLQVYHRHWTATVVPPIDAGLLQLYHELSLYCYRYTPPTLDCNRCITN